MTRLRLVDGRVRGEVEDEAEEDRSGAALFDDRSTRHRYPSSGNVEFRVWSKFGSRK